MTLQH